jgi:hypothetical protein
LIMRSSDNDEFYIGYAPPMPTRLARFVTRAVVGLGGALSAWAVVAITGHVRLEGGVFEFGHPQTFAGTVSEHPYPSLRPDGVGEGAVLLVAPGKRGADSLVRGLDRRHVTLTGTRIVRGSVTMIEVEPGSPRSDNTATSAVDATTLVQRSAQSPIELTGEIVDSKCFLGVMVPGSGKTHKDCASLCLRGGIPPALHVADRTGNSALLLLTGPDGEPIGPAAVEAAGEPIVMAGFVHQENGWLILRTDPTAWHRVE